MPFFFGIAPQTRQREEMGGEQKREEKGEIQSLSPQQFGLLRAGPLSICSSPSPAPSAGSVGSGNPLSFLSS